MSQNVFEQLTEAKGQTLVEKLGTNHEVGNVVLGFLGKIIVMASQMGKPGSGVEMGSIETTDCSNGDIIFRSRVTFHDMAITQQSMWEPQSDFAAYCRGKAQMMAKALETNPKLAFFFENLTIQIERYALQKGLDFTKLRVKQAIISTANILVLKIGKELLDA